MGQLDGKVALITGAARGQGRSHAIRLAQEGADVVAIDICAQLPTVGSPGATIADLEKTTSMVESHGRRIISRVADVRDYDAMCSITRDAVAQLGRIDIVVANAAILAVSLDESKDPARRREIWQETLDINITGVWNTSRQRLQFSSINVKGGRSSSSSTAGLNPGSVSTPTHSQSFSGLFLTAYTAAKHGVVGLMRNCAADLGPHGIRVNTIHPTGVATPMVENDTFSAYLAARPELGILMSNMLPVERLDPAEISNAVVYLASDAGKYVTGSTMCVDAGFVAR